MGWLMRCSLLAVGCVFAQAVWAQGAGPAAQNEPPQPGCLTLAADQGPAPRFPRSAIDEGRGGLVRIELRFDAPDRPPTVEVKSSSGPRSLVTAVLGHVSAYRWPCLAAGKTVTATQQFSFALQDGPVSGSVAVRSEVATPTPVDAVASCQPPRLATESLQAAFDKFGEANFQLNPGTVVARLTFVGADAAPRMDVLFDGGNQRLVDLVRKEAQNLRTACGTESAPVSYIQDYRFLVVSEPAPRLKPNLKFTEIVRLVKGLEQQRVQFDTTEMGCPFKLSFAPYQPYQNNIAAEVGARNPRREPLLDWLRTVTLDLPSQMMNTAIGVRSVVDVPCMVLNLS